MKSIGGYFEMELNDGNIYHENAIALNTGRNALEYILKESKKYKKIYLPYFTCDVLLQPIKKLGIEYQFYSINEQLEPVFDFSKLSENSCFLYTNYFGLKDCFIENLVSECKNLIIDNAQSFYSKPIKDIDTFYSPRKFFGVPDGSYLYSVKKSKENLEIDLSFGRFEHLLRRIDQNAEEGYAKFAENDNKLDNQPILQMSNLTKRILKSIDYDLIARKRIDNFLYLDKKLKSINKLKLDFTGNVPPMVYPFWGKKELRIKLLENKIYIAKYWPNVYHWAEDGSLETRLTDELLHLPIDQRQTKVELDKILKIIMEWK